MRIYIMGNSASGKTTYAKKLSKGFSTPLYSTDDFYNEKLKRMYTINEINNVIPVKGNWIIEGAYYIPEYVKAADKVIFLKTTPIVTIWRIWKRWLCNKEVRMKFGINRTIQLTYTTIRDYYNTEDIDIKNPHQKHYKNSDMYRLAKLHAKNFEVKQV